jgi:hypothetical protein
MRTVGKRETNRSHLKVFSRIWLSLTILVHRYGINGVEINVIILIFNLGLATIVCGTVRV